MGTQQGLLIALVMGIAVFLFNFLGNIALEYMKRKNGSSQDSNPNPKSGAMTVDEHDALMEIYRAHKVCPMLNRDVEKQNREIEKSQTEIINVLKEIRNDVKTLSQQS